MDQQPKIPTLKDSQRPQVKVRGMSIGLTLAERLKQFKKKDLAFILAGLGVLFMAPLAEHFMMAPESADGSLQPGWSGRGGAAGGASGVFGGGGSPYDRTDGLAPGSPTGGGSDVITPLNVRDPSALVMGPGAAQQPPTNSALPATPPAGSSRSDSDLKDALAASARGLGAAAKKASLPVPKVALGGSGLRGLGVAGGGSSASASLGPISAGNVPNRAAGGDSTGNVRSTKGYSGVARGQTSGGGGMEALKAAAGKQAENMNRGTGAATDLNAAAQTAIPSGGDGRGGGGPGAGREDKGFGGNQDKGSKSVGESLDFLNKKARMEKDLELEYKKKELDDFGLLWGQMRNEGLKTFFGETVKAVTGVWTEGLKGALTPAGKASRYNCNTGSGAPIEFSFSDEVKSCGAPKDGQVSVKAWFKLDGAIYRCPNTKMADIKTQCTSDAKVEDEKGDGKRTTVTDVNGMANSAAGTLSATPAGDLGAACKVLKTVATDEHVKGTSLGTYAAKLLPEIGKLVAVRDALIADKGSSADCDAQPIALSDKEKRPITRQQSDVITTLGGTGILSKMADASSTTEFDPAHAAGAQTAYDAIATTDADLKLVEGAMPEKAAFAALSSGDFPPGVKGSIMNNFPGEKSGEITAMFKTIGKAYDSVAAEEKKFRTVQDDLMQKQRGRIDLLRAEKSSVKKVVDSNASYVNKVLGHEAVKDFVNEGPKVAKGDSKPSTDAASMSDEATTRITTAKASLDEYARLKDEKVKAEGRVEQAQAAVKANPTSTGAQLELSNATSDLKTAAQAYAGSKEKTQKDINAANESLTETRKVQVGELNDLKSAIDKDGQMLMGGK